MTAILYNCIWELIFFFKEIKNCKIEKNNERQSVRYPKEGAMMKVTMLSIFIYIIN